MKDVLVYTLLRILLFLGLAAVVYLVALLFTDRVQSGFVILTALLLSVPLSWKLLAGPRERVAARLQARAAAASERFEEIRAKEDAEDTE